MLDFASSSDVEDEGLTAAPSASDTEILDAYSHAVTSVADTVGSAVVPAGVGSGVVIALGREWNWRMHSEHPRRG